MDHTSQQYSLVKILEFSCEHSGLLADSLVKRAFSIAAVRNIADTKLRDMLADEAAKDFDTNMAVSLIEAMGANDFEEKVEVVEITEEEFGKYIWIAAQQRSERFYTNWSRSGRRQIELFFECLRGEHTPTPPVEFQALTWRDYLTVFDPRFWLGLV